MEPGLKFQVGNLCEQPYVVTEVSSGDKAILVPHSRRPSGEIRVGCSREPIVFAL